VNEIYIVGSGIIGIEQLTLQAVEALKVSKKVLFFGNLQNVKKLESYGIQNIESITSLYKNGVPDSENYKNILLKVYHDVRKHNSISLLLPGHPKVGVTIAQQLEVDRKQHGFKLQIIPGISSFDTMIIDLNKDPLERGTVILDANRLLLFRYKIETALDHYIYHVCSIANKNTDYLNPSENNRGNLLEDYLLEFFPKEHPVKLVESSSSLKKESCIHESTIGSLSKLLTKVNFNSTLFIGAVPPKNVDKEFLKVLAK
jgi:precorrin-2 methylase